MNKSKEKSKVKSTKEENLLDLDNEIIIGIKTLPNKESKKKKSVLKKNKEKKEKNKKNNKKITSKNTNKKNKDLSYKTSKNKVKEVEDEIELKLGIEDETIKNKKAKVNKNRKPKMTKREQEIAKKKRKIIFRLVKWTSLVIILICGGIYFLLSPFFNIKIINVTGNSKITTDEIISLSGILLEENTFKVSNNKAAEAIKANAYIESVKIKRKLPDEIQIQIVERKPSYMITLGNAYVYVNTQGYLLEVSKEKLDIPILVGFVTPEEQIQEGERLCLEDLQRLSNVIQIMNSASNNEISSLITKINIENKQDYILELKSERKTVHLGDTSNLSTKMLYVKTVIEKEKKKEGDIFVNTDLSTKGAIFREKV